MNSYYITKKITQLLLYILGWLLGSTILIFLTDIRSICGVAIQYQLLLLIASIILFLYISFSITSLILYHKKSKNNINTIEETPHTPKPEIITRYIKYKKFWWQVDIIGNKYDVSETPICPNCCIPIIKQPNQWNGYDFDCLNCETPFNKYNFIDHHKSIVNILNSNSINYFENVYDKPC